MIQRFQRIMGQFLDHPPIELWRSAKDLRELNDLAIHNLTGRMSRDWKVFKICPARDSHAIGRHVEFDRTGKSGVSDAGFEVTDMREIRMIPDDPSFLHPEAPAVLSEARANFA